jgi:hypothetical protein
MIPLKDGYRGSTTPAVTLTTAGSDASTMSKPASVCRWILTLPSAVSMCLANVSEGQPSSSATCSGTVPV